MTEPSKIEDVAVLACEAQGGPGDDRFFVAVSAAGHIGWYGPVTESVATAAQQIGGMLGGQLAFQHEALLATMQLMPTHGLTRQDRSWAIGALDCATWDLHGQWTGRPVAALLAGQPTRSVAGYASLLGFDLATPAALSVVNRVADEGWAFTKWSLRARSGDGHRLARTAESAAAAAGGKAAFDAVGSWTTELGLAFSAAVDVSSLIWLEDPTYRVHRESLASLHIPLALGERLLVDEDPADLLGVPGLTALTIDVVGCGGLTRASQLVGLAGQAGIKIYPHGRSFMPALQIAAAYPTIVSAVEYRIQWEPRRQLVYQEQIHPACGTIAVGDAPGLATVPRIA